jgi:ribosome-binding protein aMBF1 (putative translation factor)
MENSSGAHSPRKYKSPVVSNFIARRSSNDFDKTKRNILIAILIDDTLKAKGWNKKQLAEVMHKNPSEVTKWLSGTHNFTLETLYLIESYLDIKLFFVPSNALESV